TRAIGCNRAVGTGERVIATHCREADKQHPIRISRKKDELFERAGGATRIGMKRDPYLSLSSRGGESHAPESHAIRFRATKPRFIPARVTPPAISPTG
ncbi:MAG TPA: hypothetical protein VL485_19050, partial [Ktedonobacteraceae bacterium]|nr:hypothetical protein [Ktedonobacteraceae bacterium]